MQRGRTDYVTTAIPILLPCSATEAEGRATFFAGPRASTPVRQLRDEDLDKKTERGKETLAWLDKGGGHWVKDLATLRRAIEAQDSLALEKASQRDPRLAQLIDQVRAAKRRDRNLPERRLSELLTSQLESVCLVLWWTGERFLPALYCPSVVSALLVRTLLGFIGGKGLRVCPYCGTLFLQTRSDQDYCSISHRESHRVALWRKKKRQTGSSKRKRR